MRVIEQKIHAILAELVNLQTKNPNYQLLQFKSLVSDYQYKHLYNLLLRYVETGEKILDWGCGNGHCSYFLLESDYKASGFAFSSCPSLKRLQSSDYHFIQGDDREPVTLPYGDSTFDAVLSVGVLEHVRETGGNEVESLKECFRILKLGGYFICYHLPNKFSWIEMIAGLIPHKFHHQYRYTPKDIYALCQQSGLDVLDLRAYGFLPRNWLGNLPPKISNSTQLAKLYNTMDDILSSIFSGICQNYWFVARKVS
jgi:ubiquinone/menaquinone biosynthesis C-methylase UbiE